MVWWLYYPNLAFSDSAVMNIQQEIEITLALTILAPFELNFFLVVVVFVH